MDEMDSSMVEAGRVGFNKTLGGMSNSSKPPAGKRYASTAANGRGRQTNVNGSQSSKQIHSSSPFRKLNDEEVFITRETEKQKRKEAKERAKNLKIWDKKTSTSRMPLKRVKDADIPPAQLEESNYNFNSEQRGYISSAMHIAKSRVQFSREQQARPQNIKEFVDQKKEMFLVQLSQNTVSKEIEELEHKLSRKQTAIETSKAQLDKDQLKLMKFIEKDQIKTSKKEREAKQAMKECQQLQDNNKVFDNDINNIRSEIGKNKDILSSLEEHKKFLLALSMIQNAAWVAEQDYNKKKKRDAIKRKWIEEHKRDARDDHIIFREDDDLFSMDAYIKGAGASSVADISEKGGAGVVPTGGAGGLLKQRKAANAIQFQQLKRENMSDKDWEAKFEMLFAEDLIEIGEDFFDEELCFNDPNDLNKIFSELEEQNLYLIHQSQELEHSLETMHQTDQDLKERLGREVETHKKNRNELHEQIQESKNSLNDLKKKSSVVTVQSTQSTAGMSGAEKEKAAAALAEQEVNIEEILNDLRRDICKVYKECKNPEMDLQAKQTIDILTELEVEIEEKMKQIHYIELIDQDEVVKEEKMRKAEYKKEQREIKAIQEKDMIEKKNMELRMRMDRVYEKVGRQPMPRSQKRRVKREVRVVKIDQETLDRQRYLGEMIQDPNGAAGQGGAGTQ